jgi:transcriptional regulator with XRE-family HTH domain
MGEKMRQIRKDKGYSLRKMAKRLKFSAAYVSDLENGKRNWRNELINAYEQL